MKSSRILTVYLTLAALLFGNVAGWVHVGCSSHVSGCCSVNFAGASGATSPQTAVDEHAGHACCHQHGHSCQTGSIAGEGPVAGKPESKPSELAPFGAKTPAEQHDSDSCSVCQGFFASRHAVSMVDTVVAIEQIAVARDVPLVDDVFAPAHLSRSHTVRGPPSV